MYDQMFGSIKDKMTMAMIITITELYFKNDERDKNGNKRIENHDLLSRLLALTTTGNGSKPLFYQVCLRQAATGLKDATPCSNTQLIAIHALSVEHEYDNLELGKVRQTFIMILLQLIFILSFLFGLLLHDSDFTVVICSMI